MTFDRKPDGQWIAKGLAYMMGQAPDDYAKRVVGRDDVNGLTISTAWTSDQGYETALVDADEVKPVERYATIEAATAGHAKWCENAKTITEVVKLGTTDGLIQDKQTTLRRRP